MARILLAIQSMKKNQKVPLLISKLLQLLPSWINEWIKGCIAINRRHRVIRGRLVDGSYNHRTGQIQIWNPNFHDLDGLFHILTHEIGHKIYQELLDKEQKKEWLIISSQELVEQIVKESYHVVKVSEEQFCWMISAALCFNIMNQKILEKIKEREKDILKTNPKSYAFVKSILDKGPSKKTHFKPKKGESPIYHWEVLAFKKWFFGNSRIKNFPVIK